MLFGAGRCPRTLRSARMCNLFVPDPPLFSQCPSRGQAAPPAHENLCLPGIQATPINCPDLPALPQDRAHYSLGIDPANPEVRRQSCVLRHPSIAFLLINGAPLCRLGAEADRMEIVGDAELCRPRRFLACTALDRDPASLILTRPANPAPTDNRWRSPSGV